MRAAQTHRGGFTVFEVIVGVVVVVILAGVVTVVHDLFFRQEIRGSWTTSPGTITAGAPATFVYTVQSRKGSISRWAGMPGRVVNFRVTPGGTVIAINAPSGTSGPNGNITVTLTPHRDYQSGGNLWATDAASGAADPPLGFTVVPPP